MSSFPMGSPVAAERHRSSGAALVWRYGLLGLAIAGLTLISLQLLLGRQLARQQRSQLATEVTANLLLGAVALERFSPEALARLSGMRLAVGAQPPWAGDPGVVPRAPDPFLRRQAALLRTALCRRLSPCPPVLPAAGHPRGFWVPMESSLEQVWLYVPLPPSGLWPPDPGWLSIALGTGGLAAGLLYQLLEVQRPLRRLQRALQQVGLDGEATPVREQGSTAVRQLSQRFNAMVERLAASELERRTMLAGIAHDLRAPLTRLRLRLQLTRSRDAAAADPVSGEHPQAPGGGAEADLEALERITGQFLLFAGAEGRESPVRLPLQELLAETAALVEGQPLTLDLQPLERCVRPISLGRAVANLLENAMAHGRPPLRLVLRPWSPPADAGSGGTTPVEGFEIAVWEWGKGISDSDWPRALTPFLRLDQARGGDGHCGLGLAIAARIARDHGGGLEPLQHDTGFAVVLRGRSLWSHPVTTSWQPGCSSETSARDSDGVNARHGRLSP